MKIRLFAYCITFHFCLALPAMATTFDDTAENAPLLVEDVKDVNDPFEPLNRGIFEFNMALDTIIFRPLAELYGVVPSQIRQGVHNVLSNLSTPVILANDILQLNFARAGETFARFLLNSTLGVFGIFDVAAEVGIPYHQEDFGQTMAAAGIGGGPYLMIPILGPSNPRDLVGKVADLFMDPINWIAWNNDAEHIAYIRTGIDLLDRRTNARSLTDRVEKTLDPYAQYRSLYIQNREYKIRNETIDTTDLPAPIDE